MSDYVLDQHFSIADHFIKRDIIRHLLTVPSARYAQLRPKNLESNLFMYHLKQLMKDGIVEKTEDGSYTLTSYGLQMSDRISLESLKLRIQPKLITILVVQKPNGEHLLIERTHQPFLNFKGFPSGKIHYGESLQDAATRELSEKTGLTGIDLSLRGTYIMRYHKDDKIINHIIGYVFTGSAPASAKTNIANEMFNSFWGDESVLYAKTSFKGHKEIIELIKNTNKDQLFLAQDDFESDF